MFAASWESVLKMPISIKVVFRTSWASIMPISLL